MNTTCCCQGEASAKDKNAGAPGTASRLVGLAEWLIPSTILALMPKCPACVAAYVALATGIGISMPTATFIRYAMGAACVASLAFLLTRSIRRACMRAATNQVVGTL
jgi:hypothetical protein